MTKGKDLLKNIYKRAKKLNDTAIPRFGSIVKANNKPRPPQRSRVRNTISHENWKRGSICCPAKVFISSEREFNMKTLFVLFKKYNFKHFENFTFSI